MTFAGINHLAILIDSSFTIIDGIHWLGVLVIQGAIIGAMGV